MKCMIVLAIALGCCVAQPGPTNPMPGIDCESRESFKVVDQNNMCWYHECVGNEDGEMVFLPRVCALGSKVSYNFVSGMSNPCTVNFDSPIFSCDRTEVSVDGPPACFAADVRMQCFNNGTARYESDKCWCECPASWQGENDCSLPTRDVTDLPPGSNICVDGEPMADFCSMPGKGCLNNGICFNQCDDFWCDCPDRENNDHIGKRCEL